MKKLVVTADKLAVRVAAVALAGTGALLSAGSLDAVRAGWYFCPGASPTATITRAGCPNVQGAVACQGNCTETRTPGNGPMCRFYPTFSNCGYELRAFNVQTRTAICQSIMEGPCRCQLDYADKDKPFQDDAAITPVTVQVCKDL